MTGESHIPPVLRPTTENFGVARSANAFTPARWLRRFWEAALALGFVELDVEAGDCHVGVRGMEDAWGGRLIALRNDLRGPSWRSVILRPRGE